MAVGYSELPPLHPVAGVQLGVACAGIKYPDRRDLVVMSFDAGSQVAGVFTRNAFCAAPVQVARRHLAAPLESRCFVINTGNANAGTGAQGLTDAERTCASLAEVASLDASQVLPFSTGVIGESLPMERIETALPRAWADRREDGWADAAHGIMTTDTVAKGASRRFALGDREITLSGIVKGSGMIRPDMATMLCFIATDAAIAPALLQQWLSEATEVSFNCITVDGDTSTNDAAMLVATGQAGNAVIDQADSAEGRAFAAALTDLCQELAQLMIRDGEGATKFVTVEIEGGASREECRQVAFTVAHSPLVKTALFASDPNWGRILAAVGRAGVSELDLERVDIHLGDVCIVRGGGRAAEYTEEAGQRVMDGEEIAIRIGLGRGDERIAVWTCDFSYDYVKINAEYRS